MKWFSMNEIHSLEDLKKAYKRLCLKHHPDRGGDAEDMKKINAEYDELIKHDWKRTKNETGTAAESANKFREVLNKIITVDCDIEIIGCWIWATGNTYPYKDILKSAGFRWCSKKRAWSWHRPQDEVTSYGKKSLGEIRLKYGSEKVNTASNRVYIAA
ncbi:MAG: hypothetical protein Q4G33_05940 [bacterium]|nr:hypothetical protein [bacterium]